MSDELNKFYKELLQDIRTTQLSEDEGGTAEQIFTRLSTELLIEAGETENVRVAYDEGQLGTRNQHKINGYGEPDNYETLDLFITVFLNSETPATVPKEEIDKACKRIVNFYRKARHKDYLNEIEEASEIWEFTHTIANHKMLHENLVRVNAVVLTDGLYSGKVPANDQVSGCAVNFRVVDLNYLYNISAKSRVPIEIDFLEEGFQVPCIPANSKFDLYQSYLAILPGRALANIYERYGARLLEQNVRSFLQFTGKVNKGIRETIRNEPEMFLAFNNGIAATADSVELKATENGLMISKVEDFQIVNGGQTTASIYHTAKKDKANIDEILVQVKLSIIKNKAKHSEIVSRIAEYSNTQNKVAFSELSSNIPFHVEIEKLSRSIVTPYTSGSAVQTKWFYERARGQYKNAKIREGFTASKRKKFELANPRNQVFAKGDLAKFINVSAEKYQNKKLVIGPHIVVRGNEKNYVEFIKHNLVEKPDNVYFEDLIAKAIIYKSAEKIYGTGKSALGDLRYVTVPYSIAWLNYKTTGRIDLPKIWRNQAISEELREVLKELLLETEAYIKSTAYGSLYAESAKKQDTWDLVKQQNFISNLERKLRKDLIDPESKIYRRRLDDSEVEKLRINTEIERIRDVENHIWARIAEWGRASEELTQPEISTVIYLPKVLRKKSFLDDSTRTAAINILNKVAEKAPDLFSALEKEEPNELKFRKAAAALSKWNKQNRIFREEDSNFLSSFVSGGMNPSDGANSARLLNLLRAAAKHGFGSE